MNTKEQAEQTAYQLLGHIGRMVSSSKSTYKNMHPTHTVVFNANVCSTDHGKIWYGDIDITLDSHKIDILAKTLGCDVYVLKEIDGRFENEEFPIYKNAVYSTKHPWYELLTNILFGKSV